MRRLIVLGCSATKKPVAVEEALYLYDGPLFRTLRNRLCELPHARRALRSGELQLLILSAEHGFIGPYAMIAPYDRLMTPQRAEEFQEFARIWDARAAGGSADEIIVAAGSLYRVVIEAAHPALRRACDEAPSGEGIGAMRQRLSRWLTERYA